MEKQWKRFGGWTALWVVSCALWLWSSEPTATASVNWTVPPAPPILPNPGFECGVGYYPSQNPIGDETLIPNGWSVLFLDGSPDVSSTRRFYTGDCNESSPRFIEKLGGIDSFLVRSQDIETPPEPGKKFDVVLYTRVPATYGGAYSLSAWMTSKCGNQNPVDCPEGNYITKSVAIDPNGGIDPLLPSLEWVEDRDNLRWQNLFTSSTALSETITIFARMTSPFQFHGNMGWMDEFSLLRAPLSEMNELPKLVEETGKVILSWIGEQSEDVENIVAGNYDLLFDVQSRHLPSGLWTDVVIGATTQMTTTFQAPCENTSYEFRVRARAEQPEDEEGAFPNHRYLGVWSKPQTVVFTVSAPVTPTVPVSPTVPISPTLPLSPTVPISTSLYMPVTARTSIAIKPC
jgi:hypothetical protein